MKTLIRGIFLFIVCLILLNCSNPTSPAGNGKLYNVTFITNGGTALDPITVPSGGNLILPSNPTKVDTSYNSNSIELRIEGWYKDSLLTQKWDFISDIVDEDITLYANWTFIGARGPSGGYIIYDDESDGNDNLINIRFLEAAYSDIVGTGGVTSFTWSNNSTGIGQLHSSLGYGDNNTNRITSQSWHTDSAAQLCLETSTTYNGSTFDDWYLPAIDELILMRTVLYEDLSIGNFRSGDYWSSTESRSFLNGNEYWFAAYMQFINNTDTYQSTTGKTSLYKRIRPIRYF